MKHFAWDNMRDESASHPVRVRGLKHEISNPVQIENSVAPRAGAWVETLMWTYFPLSKWVAPRAGAWVETPNISSTMPGM